MLRKTLLALVAMIGAASAQKTRTWSVCSAPYNSSDTVSSSSSSMKLFTCNGNLPTTTEVGRTAYLCGVESTGFQNNEALCTAQWTINGCTLTQVAIYDANSQPTSLGTWSTSAAPGVKNCPKATAITAFAYSYTDTSGGAPYTDKYTFTVKSSRTPL